MGRVAWLEPYCGGSHRAVAQGVAAHSRHAVDVFALPPRHWKWRSRGSALAFFDQISCPEQYDWIACSNMVNAAELRGLWRQAAPRCAVYFHENQLTYPQRAHEDVDAHHVLTDLYSALAADVVWFNSHFHRAAFLSALPAFLSRLPDRRPYFAVDAIAAKARVCPPGIAPPADLARYPGPSGGDLVVVWPHRWEWDKRPDVFARVLLRVQEAGIPLRLVLLGKGPDDGWRSRLERAFGDAVLASGWADGDTYWRWLCAGDVVISCAEQETFGLACVEAMAAGCVPLVPNRLSYPEIVPPDLHGDCLYDGEDDLVRRLVEYRRDEAVRRRVRSWALRHHWERRIADFDAVFDRRS